MVATKLTFNTYITSSSQLSALKNTSIQEIILEHQDLCRFGRLNSDQLINLINDGSQSGYVPILQWDVLSNDLKIRQGLAVLQQLPLQKIGAIRVQDAGIAELIRQQFPNIPLHLIVETGNHNLASLERWTTYFGKQLKRLVLSTELPGSTLKRFTETLNVPCEIMGVGRILLFYTPRHLFHFLEKNPPPIIERMVTSDEQKQHYFPTLENRHGTFLFHYYDLFLLDLLPELRKSMLQTIRIDLRFASSFAWIEKIDFLIKNFDLESAKILKAQWPVSTIHGFYRANRTDRPIARLKNKHLQDFGENLVAYVAEAIKGQHIALISRKPFYANEPLLFITPEGKEVKILPDSIKNSQGKEVSATDFEGVWIIPHYKWIVPKTLVYRMT
ncbi:MAG: U32 family peptidase [SAR324 cluster bacterium]|nr:U32 family peptidase [SAR324 cluster bacterium]